MSSYKSDRNSILDNRSKRNIKKTSQGSGRGTKKRYRKYIGQGGRKR